jgi:hypothetical protein
VRRTVPPSAEIEQQIDALLAVGVGENPRESLSELARLGARLIIQRAVEDEFDAWLGRARYERRPAHQRGLRNYDSGLRNGFRPRTVQTLEGELEVEVPQVRAAAEPFVSKLFACSTKLLRTEPLRAMVIGAFVRGLSMRDIESLCEKAGLGKLSKTTASRICTELRERFEAFKRRDLYDVQVAALFLGRSGRVVGDAGGRSRLDSASDRRFRAGRPSTQVAQLLADAVRATSAVAQPRATRQAASGRSSGRAGTRMAAGFAPLDPGFGSAGERSRPAEPALVKEPCASRVHPQVERRPE